MRKADISDVRFELVIAVRSCLVKVIEEVLEQVLVEYSMVGKEFEHVQFLAGLVFVEEEFVIGDENIDDFDPGVVDGVLFLRCADWEIEHIIIGVHSILGLAVEHDVFRGSIPTAVDLVHDHGKSSQSITFFDLEAPPFETVLDLLRNLILNLYLTVKISTFH